MNFAGTNFQAYPEFSIEIDGLTVLIGPTNKGKSSIFRALKGVLRNDIDAGFVRKNQKKPLTLTLEVDGHKIAAERPTGGSSTYDIDGKEFEKLAGKVPQEIKDLKFNEITVGDYSFDPIFADQFGRQFIIDSGPSELNTVLGAFASTEKLEAGKKEANLRIKDRNAEAKTIASEIADAETRKLALATLTAESVEVVAQIHRLESSVRLLEARTVWVGETLLRKKRLAPLREVLNSLSLPDLSQAENLQLQISLFERAAVSEAKAQTQRGVLKQIETATTDWSALVSHVRLMRAFDEVEQLLESRGNSAAEAKQLNAIIGGLEGQHKEATDKHAGIRVISQCIVLRQQLDRRKAELADIDKEISQATMCSKCGQPLEHVCQ